MQIVTQEYVDNLVLWSADKKTNLAGIVAECLANGDPAYDQLVMNLIAIQSFHNCIRDYDITWDVFTEDDILYIEEMIYRILQTCPNYADEVPPFEEFADYDVTFEVSFPTLDNGVEYELIGGLRILNAEDDSLIEEIDLIMNHPIGGPVVVTYDGNPICATTTVDRSINSYAQIVVNSSTGFVPAPVIEYRFYGVGLWVEKDTTIAFRENTTVYFQIT